VVYTTVNLREGPGTTYNILAKIPAGSRISIASCSGQWCQASWEGKDGYVIATSLARSGPGYGPPPGYPPPPPGYPPPPVYAGPPPGYYYGPGPYPGPYYYGYYGPGPYWHHGWHRHW
jgi:hypothetical protein